jgi:hypothetical protein
MDEINNNNNNNNNNKCWSPQNVFKLGFQGKQLWPNLQCYQHLPGGIEENHKKPH